MNKRHAREFARRFDDGMRAIAELLIPRNHAAEAIQALGDGFARGLREAMGPDALARNAQDLYVSGRIDADELDRRLGRIADEFGVIP